ncbi:hypothetical protein KSP40_PGU003223 [Platanthera guangdongensis]|uniref:Uncharacterized protein n=1 Tax=Platanthera guangdongensis TaxID=2320717 RepID=A0ABR2LLT6_9ASPA
MGSIDILETFGFKTCLFSCRFVSNLDVASLKPDTDMHENSGTNATRLNTKISSTITAALLSTQIHTPDHVHLSESRDSTNSHRLPERQNSTAWNKYVRGGLVVPSTDENHASASHAGTENIGSCSNYDEVSKRKGDLEFELQLAMALEATATKKEGMDVKELHDNSSLLSSHAKKVRIMKTGESSFSSRGSSGTVWSRKNGPPLYWAEVYCVDESLTGRWVHVDAANGLVDGEEQVESASANVPHSEENKIVKMLSFQKINPDADDKNQNIGANL